MEKIIFFALVIPIIGFVLYLGATAIMNGFSAKEANRSEKDEDIPNNDFSTDKEQLSNELSKLNELLQSGVLTQEEFEKAKKKILDN
jgi:protein-arginine kinase activator protein McsA